MYCVSETRTQDLTPAIALLRPDTTSFSHFTFRGSRDPISSPRDQAGIGITLSMWVERALLDLISISSRLGAFRLNSFVRVNGGRLVRCCLFAVSEYATPYCNSPEVEDE